MVDVASILLLDAVVIGLGYGLTRVFEHFRHSESKSFEAARRVSEGLFLLVYLAWVVFDLFEYVREEYRNSGRPGRFAEVREVLNEEHG